MLKGMWGNGNSPPLLVGVQTGTVTLEISMAISQNIRKQPSSRLSNTTFRYIAKDTQSSHNDMCSTIYVHSSIICNSQNLETT